MRLTCTKPDRHEPLLTCGYPLPCPHHTAIVDVAEQSITLPVDGAGTKLVFPVERTGRLGEVAEALTEPPKRKRRRRGH